MGTSREDCLDALREAAELLGASPTKAQYEELGLPPASGTIVRVVGGWNAAKETAGLATFEPGESGGTPVQPKPQGVDIPVDVDWENSNPQQRWYYKNREHRIAVKSRRKTELRQWFHDRKRDAYSCERCGEGHPACLDFHHPEMKERSVSTMVNFGHSKASIEAEFDRCVVLCANCHRKEHYERPTDAE